MVKQGVRTMADAFDRLKQRQRQTVPVRDASLVPTTPKDEMTEFSYLEEAVTPSPVKNDMAHPAMNEPVPLELARRTIRLEQEIDEQLERLCRSERITRDTFIEAVYLICSEDAKLQQQIMAIAKDRYQHRKSLGDQRKFATMAEKYSKN
jgi:hypothetical protein